MTSRINYVALLVLCLLGMTLIPNTVEAASLKRPATTRGQRKKQWRRRAEDYQAAQENTRAATSTIVTNPSSLGKGKGKGGDPTNIIHTEEDENGRTTFVVDCDEYATRKAAVQAGGTSNKIKMGGDVKETKTTTTAVKATESKTSGLVKASESKSTSESTSVTKSGSSIPEADAYCEEYLNGEGTNSGGGWVSEEGTGTEDTSNDYLPEGGSGTGGTGDTSSVSGGNGGLASCDAIAAGNGPRSGDTNSVEVKIEVVKESSLADEGIMGLMQADLQFHVAPEIADCTTDGDSTGAGSSSAGSSNAGSSTGGTLITDAVFGTLTEDTSGCSAEYSDLAITEGGDCLKTIIPVTLYYDGDDTSGFEQKVKDAIDGHQWNVPGLMQVSPVETDDSNISAIGAQEAQAEDDTRIGAGGYMAIAAAALVLLLAAVMFTRRNQRDDTIKHIELGDDDETYLRDIEGESTGSAGLVDIVGDEMSSPMDGYFSNMESRPSHQDVHVCSSATCEVCEQSRQAGVQFIPSATNMAHPAKPPTSPREYNSSDTVEL